MNGSGRRLAVTIGLTALALFSSRLPITSAAAPAKLAIGYAAMSARVVPLWLAEEQGILGKYGIDSEQVFIRGAPTLVAGLASGDIHIGSTGGSAMLAAVAAGHDLKMLAADRKSTRLNSSHIQKSRMPSSA